MGRRSRQRLRPWTAGPANRDSSIHRRRRCRRPLRVLMSTEHSWPDSSGARWSSTILRRVRSGRECGGGNRGRRVLMAGPSELLTEVRLVSVVECPFGLAQHPDSQTDQSPRDNDKGERQQRPRSNRCLGWASLVRCPKETQLLIEREPTPPQAWMCVFGHRQVMRGVHRFRPSCRSRSVAGVTVPRLAGLHNGRTTNALRSG